MNYSKLGSSGLDVSRVCLGTMTWGEQNSEAEGHEQIEYALDQGINFMDTAELYAVPTSAPTYGKTEEIIGSWFQKSKRRESVILASKVSGGGVPWVRNGAPLTGSSLKSALEASLKRLQTDYIDLYQLHWPNRDFPHFGQTFSGLIDFSKENPQEVIDNCLDILRALGDVVKEGKVKFIGLSDDTSWGIMKYKELAKEYSLPSMVSIQNEFSLLNRSDDPYVAETCVQENIAYMPWSPLGTGMLSGKYKDGIIPEGTRWATSIKVQDDVDNYRNCPQAHAAVDAYLGVAKKHSLDPTQMALAFCNQQNFVTSTIIGATSMAQLKSNISAFDLVLSDKILQDIDKVYRQYPMPF